MNSFFRRKKQIFINHEVYKFVSRWGKVTGCNAVERILKHARRVEAAKTARNFLGHLYNKSNHQVATFVTTVTGEREWRETVENEGYWERRRRHEWKINCQMKGAGKGVMEMGRRENGEPREVLKV